MSRQPFDEMTTLELDYVAQGIERKQVIGGPRPLDLTRDDDRAFLRARLSRHARRSDRLCDPWLEAGIHHFVRRTTEDGKVVAGVYMTPDRLWHWSARAEGGGAPSRLVAMARADEVLSREWSRGGP